MFNHLLLTIHTHTHIQPFYGPFSRTTQVRRCQKKISFWTFMVQGRITEADTPTIWLGNTPFGLISDPPPTFPHFLRQMPFLLQCSQFNLACDRHQICWLAYPVAWFINHNQFKIIKQQLIISDNPSSTTLNKSQSHLHI